MSLFFQCFPLSWNSLPFTHCFWTASLRWLKGPNFTKILWDYSVILLRPEKTVILAVLRPRRYLLGPQTSFNLRTLLHVLNNCFSSSASPFHNPDWPAACQISPSHKCICGSRTVILKIESGTFFWFSYGTTVKITACDTFLSSATRCNRMLNTYKRQEFRKL